MTGDAGATPELDAEGLLASIPSLADHDGLEAQTVTNLPSAHLSLTTSSDLPPGARRRPARDRRRRHPRHRHARGDRDALRRRPRRRGADRVHRGDPARLGARRRRPGERRSTRSASPPATRRPGWGCSSASAARSTTPGAPARPTPPRSSPSPRRRRARSAGSPRATRRSGRGSRATRRSTRPHLNGRVLVVGTGAGDDGTLARAALDTDPEGVVIGTLGAGHLAPPLLELWGEAAERIPVVAYCRPERGVILSATYGYRGSERDLRETKIIPAGFLSPQAARMKLLACLASELDDRRGALGVSPGRRLDLRRALEHRPQVLGAVGAIRAPALGPAQERGRARVLAQPLERPAQTEVGRQAVRRRRRAPASSRSRRSTARSRAAPAGGAGSPRDRRRARGPASPAASAAQRPSSARRRAPGIARRSGSAPASAARRRKEVRDRPEGTLERLAVGGDQARRKGHRRLERDLLAEHGPSRELGGVGAARADAGQAPLRAGAQATDRDAAPARSRPGRRRGRTGRARSRSRAPGRRGRPRRSAPARARRPG